MPSDDDADGFGTLTFADHAPPTAWMVGQPRGRPWLCETHGAEAGMAVAIPPAVPHRVLPQGAVRFSITFLGRPG